MARHHYVTGFDEKFFLQFTVLAQALSLYEPDASLYVCDFGLTDGMRAFFEKRGQLLRWDGYEPGMQAFTLKSNLIEFVAPLLTRPVIWIDADAFPTAPVGDLIEREMRSLAVWSTADLGMASIGQFIDKYRAPTFLERCQHFGIDLGRTYLNSGFFVINDPFFLRRWQEEANLMPRGEMLFEQNGFNIAAYLYGGIGVVKDGMWNLHGADLAALQCAPDSFGGLAVRCRGREVRVLHATSEQESYHQKLPLQLRSERGELRWRVKLLKDETVRAFQMRMAASYIEANRVELEACGVL